MIENFIHKYWEDQASRHGTSSEASWGDTWMLALEVETVARHLRDGDIALDVGCSNGHATLQQLERHALTRITGVDFSAKMIAAARQTKIPRGLSGRIEFEEGDIRALAFPDASFDAVYTTRVLINLPTWAEQVAGIRECLRVAKPGGRVILLEAFWEPLVLLNALRALTRLPPLVEHDFNRYLKKQKLEELLASLGLRYQVEEFSSVYYLGSRFLRELATDAAAYPGYSNPINEAFYHLEREYSGGGFGIQQAYVIERA